MIFKKNNKSILIMFSLVCVLSVCLFLTTFNASKTLSESFLVDTFEVVNMDCTPAQSLPTSLNSKDQRKGLLLTSKTEKSTLTFAKTLCGDFSMDFRVFSNTTCGLLSAKNSKFSNTDLDLSLLSFEFTDESGKAFKLYVNGGSAYNNVSPNCYIEYNGVVGGIYYYDPDLSDRIPCNTGYEPTGTTEYMNNNEIYTVINGTTFSNLAYFENKTLGVENAQSTEILFSPDDMTVKARAGSGKYYTVWDFSKEYNDGKYCEPISKFTNYSVKITFEKITSGEEANMLVYNVCNAPFESYFVSKDNKNIFAKDVYNGIVGKRYDIPKASVSNIEKGVTDFNGNVEVVFDGEVVNTNNEYFTPQQAGQYKIKYQQDGSVKEYTVEILNGKDVIVNRYYNGKIPSQISKGEKITIPSAKFVSNLNRNYSYEIPKVQLYYNDALKQDLGLADKDYFVTVSENGNYKVKYISNNNQIEDEEFDFTVSDSTVSFTNVDIKDYYFVNDTLDLSNVKAVVNGQEKDATVTVLTPSGSLENSKRIQFDSIGKYLITLNYEGYNCEYEIKVTNSVVDMFSSEKSVLEYSELPYSKLDGGLKVNAKYANEEVKYNGLIDFTDKRKDDVFVKLLINPTEYRKADFYQYTITLTDEENSDNYLYITCESTKTTNGSIIGSYVRAGFGTNVLGVQDTGTYYEKYYGRTINSGFSGVYPYLDECYMEYSYDSLENVVYAKVNGKMTIVADLNREDIFGSKFEGFKSGKAKFGIKVENVQTSASYFITEIDGVSLFNNNIDDTTSPIIKINYDGYNENSLPIGVKNKQYPIFNAVAFDGFNGYLTVDVKVFTNYGRNTQKEIAIENNAFLPTESGVYTIEYSARDNFDNSNKESINVTINDSVSELTATLLSDGVATDNPSVKSNVGEKVTLLDYSVNGGVGRTKVEQFVNLGNDNIEITNNTFTPTASGIYAVKYVITDYIHNEVCLEYSIEVTVSDNPIIVSDAVLPYGLLSGVKADIIPIKAIDYSNNNKEADISLSVKYKGQTTEKVDYNDFIPSVDNDGDKIELIFTAKGRNGETQKSYEVIVKKPIDINSNVLDASKLFIADNNATVTQVKNSTNLNDGGVLLKANGNSQIEFVNYLYSKVRAEFIIKEQKDKFDALAITLTDETNRENSVTIKYLKGDKLYLQLTDQRQYLLTGKFSGLPINFSISDNRLLDTSNATICTIKYFDNGKPFTGFSSNKVLVKFAFENVTGESELLVKRIQEQQLGAIKDETMPEYSTNGELKKQCVVGDLLTIPSASGFDVVFGRTNICVTVKQGTKSVSSVNGVVLDEVDALTEYVVKCDKRGMYTITYQAIDGIGNESRTVKIFVYVKEVTAPEVTVSWGISETVKVGTKISLPTANVVDDSSCTVSIFVLDSNGRLNYVSNNEYVFNTVGKHKVRYLIQDGDYNTVVKEFEVVVK